MTTTKMPSTTNRRVRHILAGDKRISKHNRPALISSRPPVPPVLRRPALHLKKTTSSAPTPPHDHSTMFFLAEVHLQQRVGWWVLGGGS
eukprot:gene4448-6697_t